MSKATAALLAFVLLGLSGPCLAQGLPQKPVAGERHTYEFSQFITSLNERAGVPDRTEEYESSYVASVETGNRDAEGKVPYSVHFEQVRFRLANDGQDAVHFDSQVNLAKAASRNQEFFLGALKPLVSARYMIVVDEDRKVAAVEGIDEIIKQAASGSGWLRNAFTDDQLTTRFEHELARFPADEIKPGDTWEGVDHVDCFFTGMLLKLRRRYEHLGVAQRNGRTLDKVGFTDSEVVGPPRIDWKLVKSKGTIYFDRECGLEVESSSEVQVKARIVTKPSGLQIDRTATIQTTRKLRE